MKELESVIGKIHSLEREIERLKRVEMPIIPDYGVWQDWTPTQTGWTALPTGTYRYCVIGKICFFYIEMTAGTSNSTVAQLTLPYAAVNNVVGINGYAVNNSATLTVPTRWQIPASNIINFYTTITSGAWTASGTKRVMATGFYEVK